MSDIEIALQLIDHIEHPCTVKVGEAVCDIRGFYLREAEKLMPSLENPFARQLLQNYINKYG